MKKIQIKVEGMTCGGCEKSVKKALLTNAGVNDVATSHGAGTVDISFDPAQIQIAQLEQTIEDAGFDVMK
jgi:copper chaperone